MPMKGSGETEVEIVDRFDGGAGWIAYPDERMQRASHAIEGDDGVWVVDPVDGDGVDELLSDLGEVAGVVTLFERHRRDAGTFAERHGVSVHVPEWMSGVASEIDAPVERFGSTIGGFDSIRLVDNPLWQEAVLFDGETLVVPEAVGTASYFLTRDERLGVHPMLRIRPPRSLLSYDVERVLVGHGAGVLDGAVDAIRDAVENGRRRTPTLYANAIRDLLR